MIKTWIIVLTTGMAPHVEIMEQEIPVYDETTCRSMERAPTVLPNGIYWSAKCKFVLTAKPKEKK